MPSNAENALGWQKCLWMRLPLSHRLIISTPLKLTSKNDSDSMTWFGQVCLFVTLGFLFTNPPELWNGPRSCWAVNGKPWATNRCTRPTKPCYGHIKGGLYISRTGYDWPNLNVPFIYIKTSILHEYPNIAIFSTFQFINCDKFH